MKYENPEVCSQALQQYFFDEILKMMSSLNKPIKVQELDKILKYAKKYASYCSDVVRNDPRVDGDEDASKFWNAVHHTYGL